MKLRKLCTLICVMAITSGLSAMANAATVIGTVDYRNYYQLDFGVNGEVTMVSIAPGKRVLKGTLLMALASQGFEAAVKAADARVIYLQEKLAEVTRSNARDNILYDEGSLSGVERDQSKVALLMAESEYAAAEAKLARTESRLSLSRIEAPVSGLVVSQKSFVGERINRHDRRDPALVMVSDNKVIRLVLNPALGEMPQQGSGVTVRRGSETIQGKVESVDWFSQPGSALVVVDAALDDMVAGRQVEVEF